MATPRPAPAAPLPSPQVTGMVAPGSGHRSVTALHPLEPKQLTKASPKPWRSPWQQVLVGPMRNCLRSLKSTRKNLGAEGGKAECLAKFCFCTGALLLQMPLGRQCRAASLPGSPGCAGRRQSRGMEFLWRWELGRKCIFSQFSHSS